MYLFILLLSMLACGEVGNVDSDENELEALSKGNGVIDIVVSNYDLAALMSDGTVMSWGDEFGGPAPDGLTEIAKVFANQYSFAALKKDGSVVTWGYPKTGGDGHLWASRSNEIQLKDVTPELKNVKDIVPSQEGFAALKKDGSVVTWGSAQYLDSAPLKNQLTNVKEIVGGAYGFAALKEDKTVVAWGNGDNNYAFDRVKNQLRSVKKVYRTILAFGALKEDGSFITWGKRDLGGDSSSAHIPLTNIAQVFTVDRAFGVLTKDGRMTAWGSGIPDEKGSLVNIKKVIVAGNSFPQSTIVGAFGILKKDGSVITLGNKLDGGDSTNVQKDLYNIEDIMGGKGGGMAALRKDGMAIVWGLSGTPGIRHEDATYKIPNIKKLVFVDSSLFIGMDKNEKMVVRGKANTTIPLEDIGAKLTSGVKKGFSFSKGHFAFLTEDHSLVLLGE